MGRWWSPNSGSTTSNLKLGPGRTQVAAVYDLSIKIMNRKHKHHLHKIYKFLTMILFKVQISRSKKIFINYQYPMGMDDCASAHIFIHALLAELVIIVQLIESHCPWPTFPVSLFKRLLSLFIVLIESISPNSWSLEHKHSKKSKWLWWINHWERWKDFTLRATTGSLFHFNIGSRPQIKFSSSLIYIRHFCPTMLFLCPVDCLKYLKGRDLFRS